MLRFCSKTYWCYDNKSDKMKPSSKVLSKRVLEESGEGLMAKQRRVLDEAIKLTSRNGQFRTINRTVATYEQKQKGLIYFKSKIQVQDDGKISKSLNLETTDSVGAINAVLNNYSKLVVKL